MAEKHIFTSFHAVLRLILHFYSKDVYICLMNIWLLLIALFVAVMIEGELALAAALLTTEQTGLNQQAIVMVAFLATLFSDWGLFWLGRSAGSLLQHRFKSIFKNEGEIKHFMRKHHLLILILYRYMYGFRIVTLIVLGMSKTVSSLKFMLSSLIAVSIWTILLSFLILTMEEVFVAWLTDFQWIIIMLISLMAIILAMKYLVNRWLSKSSGV